MTTDASLWMYFEQAGPVVKTVMLILLAASILSWTLILQRSWYLHKLKSTLNKFTEQFWQNRDLHKLYAQFNSRSAHDDGCAAIFLAGYKEAQQLTNYPSLSKEEFSIRIARAMRIASQREEAEMTQHLPILASIGSTSPYIGLFGTVWGIMSAFHALGQVQQATIAMVAPGISEALIATAIGLFAAIPAVLAYNRLSNTVDRLLQEYDTFQDELQGYLEQQTVSAIA